VTGAPPGRSPGMRRLIIPIALATSVIAAGSLAGASAEPSQNASPSAGVVGGLRADHPATDPTTDAKAPGQATDWTSAAPSDEPVVDDIGGGTDDSIQPPVAAPPRLITVIGHGTTLTAALDDADATAKQIAHHEGLDLGDIQTITQDPSLPPQPAPDTTTSTTQTTATTGLPAPTNEPATADETVTVAYAIG
jgi:hypothetical protein